MISFDDRKPVSVVTVITMKSVLALLGRRYDEKGNMNDWWTNSSSDAFKERSTCLIEQYNKFQVGDSHVSVNTQVMEDTPQLRP